MLSVMSVRKSFNLSHGNPSPLWTEWHINTASPKLRRRANSQKIQYNLILIIQSITSNHIESYFDCYLVRTATIHDLHQYHQRSTRLRLWRHCRTKCVPWTQRCHLVVQCRYQWWGRSDRQHYTQGSWRQLGWSVSTCKRRMLQGTLYPSSLSEKYHVSNSRKCAFHNVLEKQTILWDCQKLLEHPAGRGLTSDCS